MTIDNKSYDNIPSEIIRNILQHLTSIGDLVSCALVCKRWSYLALEILWYKPSFNIQALTSNSWLSFFTIIQATQQTTFPYASFIRRINLSPLSALIEDLHVMALRSCTRLERLTLAGCSKVTDVGLCTLINIVGSELISIDLSDVHQVTDKTIFEAAASCPNLQGLNLNMCRPQIDVTDKSIMSLAESCSNLKRVIMILCIGLVWLLMIHIIDKAKQLHANF
jgi:F-box and leucine-rich repeat protein GRR1